METITESVSYLDEFETHERIIKGLAPSSVRGYRRHVEEFLAWREGNSLAGQATRQDIEGYLAWCFYRNNSSSTRTTKTVALQNYYKFLKYIGVQDEDPTDTLPRMRSVRQFMASFNRDEIKKMLAVCDVTCEKGLRDAVFLILGSLAGFRVSEITGFNIDQISDDGKDIDLVIPKTKRGAGRSVYLWKKPGTYIRQLLQARLAAGARTGDPLLVSFFKGGRPRGNCRLSTKALDNLIKHLARKAKIRKPAIKCHMMRCAHANQLLHIRGYTLPAIMERMGWLQLETAGRYLTRRERVHREFPSLHAYWSDLWTKGESAADSNQAE